jgi:hypothetical protein
MRLWECECCDSPDAGPTVGWWVADDILVLCDDCIIDNIQALAELREEYGAGQDE